MWLLLLQSIVYCGLVFAVYTVACRVSANLLTKIARTYLSLPISVEAVGLLFCRNAYCEFKSVDNRGIERIYQISVKELSFRINFFSLLQALRADSTRIFGLKADGLLVCVTERAVALPTHGHAGGRAQFPTAYETAFEEAETNVSVRDLLQKRWIEFLTAVLQSLWVFVLRKMEVRFTQSGVQYTKNGASLQLFIQSFKSDVRDASGAGDNISLCIDGSDLYGYMQSSLNAIHSPLSPSSTEPAWSADEHPPTCSDYTEQARLLALFIARAGRSGKKAKREGKEPLIHLTPCQAFVSLSTAPAKYMRPCDASIRTSGLHFTFDEVALAEFTQFAKAPELSAPKAGDVGADRTVESDGEDHADDDHLSPPMEQPDDLVSTGLRESFLDWIPLNMQWHVEQMGFHLTPHGELSKHSVRFQTCEFSFEQIRHPVVIVHDPLQSASSSLVPNRHSQRLYRRDFVLRTECSLFSIGTTLEERLAESVSIVTGAAGEEEEPTERLFTGESSIITVANFGSKGTVRMISQSVKSTLDSHHHPSAASFLSHRLEVAAARTYFVDKIEYDTALGTMNGRVTKESLQSLREFAEFAEYVAKVSRSFNIHHRSSMYSLSPTSGSKVAEDNSATLASASSASAAAEPRARPRSGSFVRKRSSAVFRPRLSINPQIGSKMSFRRRSGSNGDQAARPRLPFSASFRLSEATFQVSPLSQRGLGIVKIGDVDFSIIGDSPEYDSTDLFVLVSANVSSLICSLRPVSPALKLNLLMKQMMGRPDLRENTCLSVESLRLSLNLCNRMDSVNLSGSRSGSPSPLQPRALDPFAPLADESEEQYVIEAECSAKSAIVGISTAHVPQLLVIYEQLILPITEPLRMFQSLGESAGKVPQVVVRRTNHVRSVETAHVSVNLSSLVLCCTDDVSSGAACALIVDRTSYARHGSFAFVDVSMNAGTWYLMAPFEFDEMYKTLLPNNVSVPHRGSFLHFSKCALALRRTSLLIDADTVCVQSSVAHSLQFLRASFASYAAILPTFMMAKKMSGQSEATKTSPTSPYSPSDSKGFEIAFNLSRAEISFEVVSQLVLEVAAEKLSVHGSTSTQAPCVTVMNTSLHVNGRLTADCSEFSYARHHANSSALATPLLADEGIFPATVQRYTGAQDYGYGYDPEEWNLNIDYTRRSRRRYEDRWFRDASSLLLRVKEEPSVLREHDAAVEKLAVGSPGSSPNIGSDFLRMHFESAPTEDDRLRTASTAGRARVHVRPLTLQDPLEVFTFKGATFYLLHDFPIGDLFMQLVDQLRGVMLYAIRTRSEFFTNGPADVAASDHSVLFDASPPKASMKRLVLEDARVEVHDSRLEHVLGMHRELYPQEVLKRMERESKLREKIKTKDFSLDQLLQIEAQLDKTNAELYYERVRSHVKNAMTNGRPDPLAAVHTAFLSLDIFDSQARLQMDESSVCLRTVHPSTPLLSFNHLAVEVANLAGSSPAEPSASSARMVYLPVSVDSPRIMSPAGHTFDEFSLSFASLPKTAASSSKAGKERGDTTAKAASGPQASAKVVLTGLKITYGPSLDPHVLHFASTLRHIVTAPFTIGTQCAFFASSLPSSSTRSSAATRHSWGWSSSVLSVRESADVTGDQWWDRLRAQYATSVFGVTVSDVEIQFLCQNRRVRFDAFRPSNVPAESALLEGDFFFCSAKELNLRFQNSRLLVTLLHSTVFAYPLYHALFSQDNIGLRERDSKGAVSFFPLLCVDIRTFWHGERAQPSSITVPIGKSVRLSLRFRVGPLCYPITKDVQVHPDTAHIVYSSPMSRASPLIAVDPSFISMVLKAYHIFSSDDGSVVPSTKPTKAHPSNDHNDISFIIPPPIIVDDDVTSGTFASVNRASSPSLASPRAMSPRSSSLSSLSEEVNSYTSARQRSQKKLYDLLTAIDIDMCFSDVIVTWRSDAFAAHQLHLFPSTLHIFFSFPIHEPDLEPWCISSLQMKMHALSAYVQPLLHVSSEAATWNRQRFAYSHELSFSQRDALTMEIDESNELPVRRRSKSIRWLNRPHCLNVRGLALGWTPQTRNCFLGYLDQYDSFAKVIAALLSRNTGRKMSETGQHSDGEDEGSGGEDNGQMPPPGLDLSKRSDGTSTSSDDTEGEVVDKDYLNFLLSDTFQRADDELAHSESDGESMTGRGREASPKAGEEHAPSGSQSGDHVMEPQTMYAIHTDDVQVVLYSPDTEGYLVLRTSHCKVEALDYSDCLDKTKREVNVAVEKTYAFAGLASDLVLDEPFIFIPSCIYSLQKKGQALSIEEQTLLAVLRARCCAIHKIMSIQPWNFCYSYRVAPAVAAAELKMQYPHVHVRTTSLEMSILRNLVSKVLLSRAPRSTMLFDQVDTLVFAQLLGAAFLGATIANDRAAYLSKELRPVRRKLGIIQQRIKACQQQLVKQIFYETQFRDYAYSSKPRRMNSDLLSRDDKDTAMPTKDREKEKEKDKKFSTVESGTFPASAPVYHRHGPSVLPDLHSLEMTDSNSVREQLARLNRAEIKLREQIRAIVMNYAKMSVVQRDTGPGGASSSPSYATGTGAGAGASSSAAGGGSNLNVPPLAGFASPVTASYPTPDATDMFHWIASPSSPIPGTVPLTASTVNPGTVDMSIDVRIDRWVWELVDGKDVFAECVLHSVWANFQSCENDSGSSMIEAHYLYLRNRRQMPYYETLLAPLLREGNQVPFSADDRMIRIFTKSSVPVGGIGVYDHFEIDIHPLVIQLTYELYHMLWYYFFPRPEQRQHEIKLFYAEGVANYFAYIGEDDEDTDVPFFLDGGHFVSTEASRSMEMRHFLEEVHPMMAASARHGAGDSSSSLSGMPGAAGSSSMASGSNASASGSAASASGSVPASTPSSAMAASAIVAQDSSVSLTAVDEMKLRAQTNMAFSYFKIQDVRLTVSFKGEKEHDIKDLRDVHLHLHTIEYHAMTGSWGDVAEAVKRDVLRDLIPQTVSSVTKRKLKDLFSGRSATQRKGRIVESTPQILDLLFCAESHAWSSEFLAMSPASTRSSAAGSSSERADFARGLSDHHRRTSGMFKHRTSSQHTALALLDEVWGGRDFSKRKVAPRSAAQFTDAEKADLLLGTTESSKDREKKRRMLVGKSRPVPTPGSASSSKDNRSSRLEDVRPLPLLHVPDHRDSGRLSPSTVGHDLDEVSPSNMHMDEDVFAELQAERFEDEDSSVEDDEEFV